MAKPRPQTIPEYIKAAPRAGQPNLRKLYAILKSAAPKAEERIKWGNPFFVEPRFVYAFSAHKAHLSFAPMAATMKHFRKELAHHQTTRHFLKVPYDEPLPAALIRKMAQHCVRQLRAKQGDKFW